MAEPLPAPEDFALLHRRAFAEYGAHALWNKRMLEEPAGRRACRCPAPCASKATAKPGSWRNRSRERAVPLYKIQTDILRILASQPRPGKLRRRCQRVEPDASRYSGDIDVFHGREERAATGAGDAETLEQAGYSVRWVRREPAIYAAEVTGPAGKTHLEWVVDSEFRSFPVMKDDTFGYMLHPVDLATNKIMAAANRRELRDIVDLVTIH
jgi:hypothetical protein